METVICTARTVLESKYRPFLNSVAAQTHAAYRLVWHAFKHE